MRLSDARRPAALSALALALVVAPLACASRRAATSPAPPPASSADPDSGDWAVRLVDAHNAERARRRLRPLVPNPLLDAAARGQAEDMARRHRMGHKGSDGSSPFDRISRQGYRFRSAGENVAYGFDEVEPVMGGWMRSPGHKRNILGDYAEIGVGRAVDSGGSAYWSVTFGTPRVPSNSAASSGRGL